MLESELYGFKKFKEKHKIQPCVFYLLHNLQLDDLSLLISVNVLDLLFRV